MPSRLYTNKPFKPHTMNVNAFVRKYFSSPVNVKELAELCGVSLETGYRIVEDLRVDSYIKEIEKKGTGKAYIKVGVKNVRS